ncbi:hypothetical protein CDD80_1923 [Ophiocordyceps camponoti-rufipedis]|uniref:Uncharacterized protein n=1 Tax=Ophiocordyceps camponoti-rufipedis TaxID=2004952 RepID=A0A2C5Z9W9_9HYPO|nr:hypothetical protein CDD80_1923 [Ophiocordyceps camponoti-rufipedis]
MKFIPATALLLFVSVTMAINCKLGVQYCGSTLLYLQSERAIPKWGKSPGLSDLTTFEGDDQAQVKQMIAEKNDGPNTLFRCDFDRHKYLTQIAHCEFGCYDGGEGNHDYCCSSPAKKRKPGEIC